MISKQISALDFHLELVLACETERRLPRAHRRASLAYWPDYLPEWLSYADDKTQVNLARATSDQISRYDQVCEIVVLAPTQSRKLIWAVGKSAAFRNRGPSWLKLSKIFRMDRRRIKREYIKAMVLLLVKWRKT